MRIEEKEVYKEQVINGLAAIVKELKEIRNEIIELKKMEVEILKLLNTISYRYWRVNQDKLGNDRNGKKEERVEKVEKVEKVKKPYYDEEEII